MPRAGLSTGLVVSEAARLADEEGLGGVTLAAVAERFGVAYPSLYKHIGGLADLRGRLGALALRELGDALREAAVGRSGFEALRGMALAYRGYAEEHPGRYEATLGAPGEDEAERAEAAEALLSTVFAVLAGYGLTGDDAVHATRAVHSGLHGFVSLEAAGAFGMPQSVEASFELLVSALDGALTGWPTTQGAANGSASVAGAAGRPSARGGIDR